MPEWAAPTPDKQEHADGREAGAIAARRKPRLGLSRRQIERWLVDAGFAEHGSDGRLIATRDGIAAASALTLR